MGLFFDGKLQGLALLSLTRAALSGGGTDLPLPELSVENFMALSWDDLGCEPQVRVQAGIELARMFPPAGVAPGDVDDEIGLQAAFARLPGPADTAAIVADRWRDCHGRSASGRVVFMSSGSAGKPKATVHSWAMLMQDLEAVMPLLPPLSRVITLTPLQHYYGFMFGVLAARYLGLRHLALPPLPPVVRKALAPGDMLVGFPDFWRDMSRTGYRSPEDLFCLSFAAPWPEAEQHALRASGCGLSLEVFVSGENGVLGWRAHPDNPFKLLHYWSRDPDAPGVMSRALPGGEKQCLSLREDFHWEDERHFRRCRKQCTAKSMTGNLPE